MESFETDGFRRATRRATRGATAAALALGLVLLAFPPAAHSAAQAASPASGPAVTAPAELAPAQAMAAGSQSLESHSGYNSDYLFGMTRGVADSTLTPALKPMLFIFTLPLDVAFLPFALIGGLF